MKIYGRICFAAASAIFSLLLGEAAAFSAGLSQKEFSSDVVVYGCTVAGITAAIEAKWDNKSVTLICREDYVGGMSTNGLGWADTRDHSSIGGLARKFYTDVKNYYLAHGGNVPLQSQSSVADPSGAWVFEPHVAEYIYESWLSQNGIVPVRSAKLLLSKRAVKKVNGAIVSIQSTDGRVFAGKIFLDATYEGDLMAMAGVSYIIGRESNKKYHEQHNGVQTAVDQNGFDLKIDPYKVPGVPGSGLLARISSEKIEKAGTGDNRIQAYNFRVCMTKRPEIRTPLPKPANYDASQYELLGRMLNAGWDKIPVWFGDLPNGKSETNNNGPVSTDDIGVNYRYPSSSYEDRQKIIDEHIAYQQGLLWYLQNDHSIPEKIHDYMKDFGLCADEFKNNGNWPREIYVREARRMVSDFVMTESDLLGQKKVPLSIGLGSYMMDSHNVRRFVDAHGFVQDDGDVEVEVQKSYPISYRSIVPKQGEARNLIVPVAVSASHIAYGSIRMEPVFMILGQSAGAAAALAIDEHADVQHVNYAKLRDLLKSRGQVLDPAPLKK